MPAGQERPGGLEASRKGWIGKYWLASHTLDAQGGRRMTGSALQAMDVLYLCASLSLEKGRGFGGRVVPGRPGADPGG